MRQDRMCERGVEWVLRCAHLREGQALFDDRVLIYRDRTRGVTLDRPRPFSMILSTADRGRLPEDVLALAEVDGEVDAKGLRGRLAGAEGRGVP